MTDNGDALLPGDPPASGWRAIHDATLVVDGLDCSAPTEAYATKLRGAGVGCVHLTVEDQDPRGGVHPFVTVLELLDRPGCSFGLARTVAGIEAARRAGLIALVLGWQGADPVNVEHGTSAPTTSSASASPASPTTRPTATAAAA